VREKLEERLAGMQRVRIGLTGLAFVFVLVLLAAVFSSPSDEPPITANFIEQSSSRDAGAEAEPKEPLAELGVAPGNADTNSGKAAGSGSQGRR
jgi:hypothetical protein